MRVLTLGEIRGLDRCSIEETGIPSLVLMENAALGVVEALSDAFPEAQRVAVVCGPGNNGADGLAAARHLLTRGYAVVARLATFGRPLSADCTTQLGILRRLGCEVVEVRDGDEEAALAEARACDVVIDALFGAGLSRALEGPWARLVEALSAVGRPVVAVDLPSGLDGDRGALVGPAVRADLTVTFVAPKPALVLPPACDRCGEIVVADLGFPTDPGGGPGTLHLLLTEELAAAVPARRADAHKGDFGHLLVVAGSRGKAGAAVLAARAAVAAGAGLVTVALPDELAVALAEACPEAMTLPLPTTPSGGLAATALMPLLRATADRSALAVGPGLGTEPETFDLVRRLAIETELPLALDADGLNAFAGALEALSLRRGPTVLTPHPGELARLLARSTAEIQGDRLGAAREAALRAGAVVVLKGRRSIVAAPDGEAWVNTTGNPGMASGGAGDVLTGLVGARLAQGDEPEFAAALSVHWHGLAGDLASARLGGPAVPAAELAATLGAAWRAIEDA